MTTIDPEQERARLAQLYAGMTPEQLAEVADAAESLTEAAWLALSAEMRHRGMAVPDAQPPGPAEDRLEKRSLVMVRRFRDLPEAALAKGLLESAGIESFYADDNLVRMDWFYSNAVGGIKLLVDEANAEEARTLLDQPIPAAFDVEGVGEYQQPRCPQCDSLDVYFAELNEAVAYGSAWLGFPIPLHDKAWKCHACGHRWQAPADASFTPRDQDTGPPDSSST